MSKILIDDEVCKVIDDRKAPLDSSKYPSLIKVCGANEVKIDFVGYVGTKRVYSIKYVWQTLFAKADMDYFEKFMKKRLE